MKLIRTRSVFAALVATTLIVSSFRASGAALSSGQAASPASVARTPAGTFNPLASYTQFCFGDGSSGPCPCFNNSAVGANEGCVNSTGAGAMLSGSGNASITNDSLLLTATNLTPPNGAICIFVQGSAIISAVPFGAGLRCFAGVILRIGIRPIVASTSQLGVPVTGMVHLLGGISTPGVYNYAVYYRDVGTPPCPQNFNVTNGLKVTWAP